MSDESGRVQGPAGLRIAAVRRVLTTLQPMKVALADQPPSHFMDVLDLVCRAAYIRQHEALVGHVSASAAGHGHATVLILRPAFEEMLWLEYLGTLDAAIARELLGLLTAQEIGQGVEAQQKHLGKRTMKELGFSSHFVNQTGRQLAETRRALSKLGSRLGFPVGDQGRWFGPSMGDLAAITGQEALYSFLYSGTSRTVHFSPAELMRRSWFGEDRTTHISSDLFESYWADFGLAWGTEILMHTAVATLELMPSEFEFEIPDTLLGEVEDLMSMGRVPIVTREEMNL